MKVVELKNKNIKLVADRGKMIQSKAMHYDEELGQEVSDISGEVIYLVRMIGRRIMWRWRRGDMHE